MLEEKLLLVEVYPLSLFSLEDEYCNPAPTKFILKPTLGEILYKKPV